MDIRLLPAANKYLSNNEKLLRYDRVKITDAISNEFERLPELADNFNYVAVDINSDGTLIKEILTFFDNAGTMLSRFFLENGVSKRRHDYSCKDDTSEVNKFIESDIAIPENAGKINLYKNLNHWISSDLFKKISVIENGDSKPNHILHKKTLPLEHPKGCNYARSYIFSKYYTDGEKEKTQSFSATLENLFNQQERAKITKTLRSENLDINMDDDFLTARIIGLRSSQGISELVKILLEQRGLSQLGIKTLLSVIKQYPNDRIKRLGTFKMSDFGTYIVFSNSLIKSYPIDSIVCTAGHEADHAWRYSLIGRLGAGQTKYEIKAGQTLHPLSLEESEEAIRCKFAEENYVPPEVNFEEYYRNYIEVKAREEGENTVNEFKRSKENYDFFSEFDNMYH